MPPLSRLAFWPNLENEKDDHKLFLSGLIDNTSMPKPTDWWDVWRHPINQPSPSQQSDMMMMIFIMICAP
jgi:hypothetical protein